ncbi:hypothetical protein, partial [Bacteroides pyogenes]|uniref:hypothetical protein n=1 Tax=Bacteroides pyogenes TaxID=310300 RepID=UPI002FDB81F7
MKAKLSIIIAIFILFYAGVSRATSIDIKREQTTHHGGMRVPSITKVTADYDDGVVTITLQNYSG